MAGLIERVRGGLSPWLWLIADAGVAALVAIPAETLLLYLLSPDLALTLGGFASTALALLPQVIGLFVLAGPALVALGNVFAVGRTTRTGIQPRYVLHFLLLDCALLAVAAVWQWRGVGHLLAGPARAALALTITSLLVATALLAMLALLLARRPSLWPTPWIVAVSLGLLVALGVAAELRRVRPERPRPLVLGAFPPARGVLLVEIPGLSREDLDEGVRLGSLPGLASVLERGTLLPVAGGPVPDTVALHATLVTGKGPREHGILGSVRYRPVFGRRSFAILPRGLFLRRLLGTPLWEKVPVDWRSLTAVALPEIARGIGVPLAIVGDPLAWPSSEDATRVSWTDRRLAPGGLVPMPGKIPPVICPEFPADEIADRFFDPPASRLKDTPRLARLVGEALSRDLCALHAARELARADRWPLLQVRLSGYYQVAYQFAGWRPGAPARAVSDMEVAAYGRVLLRYLRELDPPLGELLEAAPGRLVVVVSEHGMEPRRDVRRLLAELVGKTTPTGTHAGPPAGLVVFAGEGVRPGRCLSEDVPLASVLPTLLWGAGLPPGEDMGPLLPGVFEDEWVAAHPAAPVPSWGIPPAPRSR